MVLKSYYTDIEEEQRQREEERREASKKNNNATNWTKGVAGLLSGNEAITRSAFSGSTDNFLKQSSKMSTAEMIGTIASLVIMSVAGEGAKRAGRRSGLTRDITTQSIREQARAQGVVLGEDLEAQLDEFATQWNSRTPTQRAQNIADFNRAIREDAQADLDTATTTADAQQAQTRIDEANNMFSRYQQEARDLNAELNTAIETRAPEPEAEAVNKSGLSELETLANETLAMLEDVEGKNLTNLQLKNAQIDDLLQRYAGGEDVFADLQEAYIKRAGLTPEQVASRQATARAEMNRLSALESDAFNSTYGRDLNVGKGAMHKRMMTHLAVMGVSGSAIGMIIQRAIGVQKDDSKGAPSMNVQPIGEVVGEEVAKTAGKIAGAQAGAAAVGTELTGSGAQVAGETAVNIATGAGVPGADVVSAVVDAVKGVQTAETVAGITTAEGAVAVGAVAGGAAVGATVASALYQILANEFSTPVEHQHVDQLHEIARTHHSSVHGYIEGDTTASVLSRDHILELVHKSQKVYDADQPESVQVFDDASTDFRAVLYANNDHDILSFRGTGSLTNAITDLNFVSAKLSEHFEGVTPDADLSCHQGFLQMLKTQYDPIVEALSARIDRPLRVTGHSMGAGLGCVFTYLYGVKSPDANHPTETITFGSPRVFTTGSRMTYNARVENCFTVITDRDPVCQLPPVALGYEHIGKVITLFENPGILFRPTQKSDDRRLKSAQVNVARFNYYAGFADVEYRATMKALTTDQQTFQYCKDTVLDEFDTHRESVPDETYTAIQNATMPDKSVFAQVINGNVNLRFDRPSTFFIQGLETSAHTLTCYERRVQKLPQQLLDIDLKDDKDDEDDEEGDVAVEDDDDGFRGVHEFNGAEPAHTEGMHADHYSRPTVDFHEAVARQRKQPVEQPTDPFHSRLQEHVADANSYVLGYVVYSQDEADMYENAIVGFV